MKRVRVTEELAYGKALDRLTGADEAKATAEIKEAVLPAGEPETTRIKLSVFLGRGEDAYLESLSSAAKFSGGKKISKTKLVEAMVRAFRTVGVDVRGVKGEEELFHRLIAQLRK